MQQEGLLKGYPSTERCVRLFFILLFLVTVTTRYSLSSYHTIFCRKRKEKEKKESPPGSFNQSKPFLPSAVSCLSAVCSLYGQKLV